MHSLFLLLLVRNAGFGAAEADQRAKEIMEEVFKGRSVVQLQVGRHLALGGGNIHCITQQQPKPL